MTERKRNLTLFFLGLAALAMVLLSAGLPRLVFLPGQPFSVDQAGPSQAVPFENLPGGELFLLLMRGLIALALVVLPFYILFSLFTKEGRRKLLMDAILLIGFYLLANLMARSTNDLTPRESQISELPAIPATAEPGPLATFIPRIIPWLDYAVILGLAALLTVTVAIVLWGLQTRQKPTAEGPLKKIEQEAQQAVEAIQAGEGIRDVVIRSYIQMGRILQEERGIQRERAMTPHEFLEILTRKGLPEKPVRDLTRLFEEVRYGDQSPGQAEESQAVASLTAIIAFCRGYTRPGSA
jgi:hypothetical protein